MDLNVLKTQLEEHKAGIEKMLSEKSGTNEAVTKQLKDDIETLRKSLASIDEQLKMQGSKFFNDKKDEQKFSISRFVKGIINAKAGVHEPWKNAGAEFEYDAHRQYRDTVKTALAGDSANLGYLIPNNVSDEIIKNVWASLALNTMGATNLTNLIGDFYLPKEANKYSTYWLGENAAPTQSDISMGQIHMSPKKIGAYAKFSRMLQQQTSGNADRIIMDNLSSAIADGIHDKFLNGTGNNAEPRGICNFASINDRSEQFGNGRRLNSEMIAEDYYYLLSLNELKENSKFGVLMNALVMGGIMRERVQQFSGQSVGLGQPVMGLEQLMNVKMIENALGIFMRQTSHLVGTGTWGTSTSCAKTIMGDFSKIVMGTWRDVEIRASDIIDMKTDEIAVVAFACVDIACKRETALTIRKDCETDKSKWTY